MTDEAMKAFIREVGHPHGRYLKAKRLIGQKVRELLGIQPRLKVEPKHRISGPRLVVDGAAWHTPEGQAKLPPPVFGPRCRECAEAVFASADSLHGLSGLCGRCMATLGGTIAAPPLQTDDGPQAA